MDFNKWNTFWSVCFGMTAVVIITCNFLSVLILLKRRLRKRSHYLLIDLAIADLMVGLFTIPIYMVVVISEDKLVSRFVLDCVDMFTGFASIFTLTVISLERLNAIARPLRHYQLSSRSYIVAMVTPWILSLIATSSRVFNQFSFIEIHNFIIVIAISLSTPLLVSSIAYFVIWRKQATRLQNDVRARSDAMLSKTLFLITGTFVLTWLPFKVLVIVLNMCLPCKNVPIAVVFVIKLLQFSNSFINFVIYCLRITDYRKAVSEIFARGKCRRTRLQEPYPLDESKTNVTLVSVPSRASKNTQETHLP